MILVLDLLHENPWADIQKRPTGCCLLGGQRGIGAGGFGKPEGHMGVGVTPHSLPRLLAPPAAFSCGVNTDLPVQTPAESIYLK